MGESKRRAAGVGQETPKVVSVPVLCEVRGRGRLTLTLKIKALGETAMPGSEHQKGLIQAAIEALGKANKDIKVIEVGTAVTRPN